MKLCFLDSKKGDFNHTILYVYCYSPVCQGKNLFWGLFLLIESVLTYRVEFYSNKSPKGTVTFRMVWNLSSVFEPSPEGWAPSSKSLNDVNPYSDTHFSFLREHSGFKLGEMKDTTSEKLLSVFCYERVIVFGVQFIWISADF